MNSRRYLRIEAFLPVQCTPLSGNPMAKVTGKTKSLSPNHFELLLPETISFKSEVSVQVYEEEPLPGLVIWLDDPISTDLATRVPHGVAFDEPVDEDRIRRWVRNARKRAHPRVRVQFDVEFAGAEKVRPGTCLSLSRGGMFIAATDPPPPGTVTSLLFKLHDTSHTLFIPTEVAWMHGEASGPSAITGMGVKFLDVNREEAALIRSVVDGLLGRTSPSPDSS